MKAETIKEAISKCGYIKLKACPLCGSMDCRIELKRNPNLDDNKWRVRCRVCSCRISPLFDSPIHAAKKWNSRLINSKIKITKVVCGKLQTHIEHENYFEYSQTKEI